MAATVVQLEQCFVEIGHWMSTVKPTITENISVQTVLLCLVH